MNEKSRHVLVVGASSGVGKAVAERLSGSYTVSAVARRGDKLLELAQLGVKIVEGDVCIAADVDRVLKSVIESHGLLSALIYCAGTQSIRPLRGSKRDEVHAVYDVNLIAPTMLAAQFASQRVSTRSAVFCAISSIAAQRPEPGIISYSASKAGLEGLIKGMARELAPRRSVGVAPGWLDTEMTRGFPNVYTDEARERMEKASPLGLAPVSAVVDAIEFLISDKAAFITGETIRVDGGAAL